MDQYLVTWDIAADLSQRQTRLYREIQRLAAELGFERIGGSVYLVEGESAEIRAHTLAELASRFGAGSVGDNGPVVYRLADESPHSYFASRDLAKRIADALLVDHRRKANKRMPRDVSRIVIGILGAHPASPRELRGGTCAGQAVASDLPR